MNLQGALNSVFLLIKDSIILITILYTHREPFIYRAQKGFTSAVSSLSPFQRLEKWRHLVTCTNKKLSDNCSKTICWACFPKVQQHSYNWYALRNASWQGRRRRQRANAKVSWNSGPPDNQGQWVLDSKLSLQRTEKFSLEDLSPSFVCVLGESSPPDFVISLC